MFRVAAQASTNDSLKNSSNYTLNFEGFQVKRVQSDFVKADIIGFFHKAEIKLLK